MSYFYNQSYFRQLPANVPELKDYFPEFKRDIEKLLRNLDEEDSSEFLPEKDLLRTYLYRAISFYLTVAPKPTLRLIVLHCFDKNSKKELIIQLLRRFPALICLTVVHQFNKPYEELLIATLFRRFLKKHLDWKIAFPLIGSRRDFLIIEFLLREFEVLCRQIPDSLKLVESFELVSKDVYSEISLLKGMQRKVVITQIFNGLMVMT